jgi:flagellar hook-length control protein FliK
MIPAGPLPATPAVDARALLPRGDRAAPASDAFAKLIAELGDAEAVEGGDREVAKLLPQIAADVSLSEESADAEAAEGAQVKRVASVDHHIPLSVPDAAMPAPDSRGQTAPLPARPALPQDPELVAPAGGAFAVPADAGPPEQRLTDKEVTVPETASRALPTDLPKERQPALAQSGLATVTSPTEQAAVVSSTGLRTALQSSEHATPEASPEAAAPRIEQRPVSAGLPPSPVPPPAEPAGRVSEAEHAPIEPGPARVGPHEAPRAEDGQMPRPAVAAQAQPVPATGEGLRGLATEATPIEFRLATDTRGAPPATAATISPAATAAQAVASQIAVAIKGAEQDHIEIRLDPPELGRVKLELRVVEGSLQALLTAERGEIQDLMRRHADLLQRDLEAAGYLGVALAFGGESDGDGQPTSDERRAKTAGSEPVIQLVATAGRRPEADGRLDIRL